MSAHTTKTSQTTSKPTTTKKGRDFLSFWDVPDGGIEALIRRAEELRLLRSLGTAHPTRPGRVLGMVFEKASTRTRASFEIAMYELGGHALYLGMQGSQLERGEPLRDTARVLSGYCHAIMLRTFGHERAEEMAHYAAVPVINGLTDLLHPCQVLADGSGGGGGRPAPGVRRLLHRRRPDARRRAGRDGPPLFARSPRRGDHRRGDRGAGQRGLAAGGEPPARAEGAGRVVAALTVPSHDSSD